MEIITTHADGSKREVSTKDKDTAMSILLVLQSRMAKARRYNVPCTLVSDSGEVIEELTLNRR